MSKSNFLNGWWHAIRSYMMYNESLDPLIALRGVACLIVIWFHIQAPIAWLYINSHNLSFLTSPNGFMAVYIFYLISGYCVGYGFFSKKYTLSLKSLRSFYTNRFLRIAPAYYVCILLSIFIFYPQRHVIAYDIVRFFTFTANYDYTNLPFQGLIVIISTEMQFYLIAPLLYAVLTFVTRKIHPLVVGALILLVGLGIRYSLLRFGFVSDFDAFATHVYVTVWGVIDIFLFGMFLSYLLCVRKASILWLKTKIPNPVYVILLIGWFLWVNYSNFYFASWAELMRDHLFVLPPTLCLLIGWYILSTSVRRTFTPQFRTTTGIIKLLFHPRTFVYGIGFISYGLYMYHYVYLDLLYLKPGYYNNTWPLFMSEFITILIITTGTALASYYFVEYPFLKLKSHKP